MSDVIQEIKDIISANDVVLFMKGNADFPQCGFSAKVAAILGHVGVEYKDINVLENSELRESIKEFSDWPTIPQLYVKQEFIGGCDIITDMFEAGELNELFNDNGIKIAS